MKAEEHTKRVMQSEEREGNRYLGDKQQRIIHDVLEREQNKSLRRRSQHIKM